MNQTVYCHFDFATGHDVFGPFVSVTVVLSHKYQKFNKPEAIL